MKESPKDPGWLSMAAEGIGMAGLIVVMAYAIPLGFELFQG
jgi:hypothetical protein